MNCSQFSIDRMYQLVRREVQELFTVQCRSKVSSSEEGGTGTVYSSV